MRKTHIYVAAAVLACCASAAFAQGQSYLRSIEVHSARLLDGDRAEANPPRRFTALIHGRATASLELGEEVEGHEVVLSPRRGVSAEFMVEQRFETSLTVTNEGPHLDLLDWKHHVSQWRRLEEVGQNRFLIQHVDGEEGKSFPAVSPEEIRAAVLKRGGEEWAQLVKDVRGPHDPPAVVAVSLITLRVSVRDGGDWKVIQVIDLYVPMGC